MRVLIITEDHELDQYVVKPVIERVMKQAGRTAQVDVLTDPHLRGAADAL